MRKHLVVFLMLVVVHTLPTMAQEVSDNDRLEMAIAYFQSGKYHEALLLFERLDKDYALNPRFQGFMGVCYFHEWLYEEACKKLDAVMPQLEVFAPHERSVYYYTAGESHFELRQFAEAIPYYEKALTVCYDNEKGDINYRLGLCYMFLENWHPAHDHYDQALDYLIAFRDTPEKQARIKQAAHMMGGCQTRLEAAGESLTDEGEGRQEQADTGSPALMAASDTTQPSDTLSVSDVAEKNTDSSEDQVKMEESKAAPTVPPSELFVGPVLPELSKSVTITKRPMTTDDKDNRRLVKTQPETPSTQNIDAVYEQKVEVVE